MLDYPCELTAQERAALALWLFQDGWVPTTAEAAQRLGISQTGARALLRKLGRVCEISQDDGGRWHLVARRVAVEEALPGEDPDPAEMDDRAGDRE